MVKGYDEKYNVDEEDKFESKDKEQEEERQKMESERSKTLFKIDEHIFCQACHRPCHSSSESSSAASLP